MAETKRKAATPRKKSAANKKAKATQRTRPAFVTRVSSARAGRPTAVPARRTQPTPSPYTIIHHPMVTEKTMFGMDKNNTLEFLVADRATKPQIKAAVEELFDVKVHKVTTRHAREGKRAVVRFAEGYSAEDVGTRIGVF